MKILSTSLLLLTLSLSVYAQKLQQTATTKELYEKIVAAKKVQILDARGADEFAVNHLRGAVQAPVRDSVALNKVISTLDPNALTITYSIGPGRSVSLAKKLKEKGFAQVYYLPEGISGWVGAGYPVYSKAQKGEFTPEYFEKLLKNNEVVFVDFASRHCPGCLKLQHTIEELKNEFDGKVKVVSIELDENLDVIKTQNIKTLPTLRIYKHGQIAWEHRGRTTKEQLETEIKNNL